MGGCVRVLVFVSVCVCVCVLCVCVCVCVCVSARAHVSVFETVACRTVKKHTPGTGDHKQFATYILLWNCTIVAMSHSLDQTEGLSTSV